MMGLKWRIRKGNMKGKHQDTKALSDVLAEMQRQDAKWGQTVIKILLSGERFSGKRWESFIKPSSMIVLVVKQLVPAGEEAVQIAAVALQIIEYYDRVSN